MNKGLHFNPCAKFKTFRHMTPSSFRPIAGLKTHTTAEWASELKTDFHSLRNERLA